MYKRNIKYTNYNGVEMQKDLYFNLSKPECYEIEAKHEGGLLRYIERIIQTSDRKELISIFQELLLTSYGEKSLDGETFLKTEEIKTKFKCSPAYEILYMELATDANKAAEFINGITPSDVEKPSIEEVKAKLKTGQLTGYGSDEN